PCVGYHLDLLSFPTRRSSDLFTCCFKLSFRIFRWRIDTLCYLGSLLGIRQQLIRYFCSASLNCCHSACNSFCMSCNSSFGIACPSFARLLNWFTLFPIARNWRDISNAPCRLIFGARILAPCAFFLQKEGTLIPASFAIRSSRSYSLSLTRKLTGWLSFRFTPKRPPPIYSICEVFPSAYHHI